MALILCWTVWMFCSLCIVDYTDLFDLRYLAESFFFFYLAIHFEELKGTRLRLGHTGLNKTLHLWVNIQQVDVVLVWTWKQ